VRALRKGEDVALPWLNHGDVIYVGPRLGPDADAGGIHAVVPAPPSILPAAALRLGTAATAASLDSGPPPPPGADGAQSPPQPVAPPPTPAERAERRRAAVIAAEAALREAATPFPEIIPGAALQTLRGAVGEGSKERAGLYEKRVLSVADDLICFDYRPVH